METDPHLDLLGKADEPVRERLEAIQQTVERAVPGATRITSYRMPAYRKGKVFFYFGAFKKHIGVYPPVLEPAELVAELLPWRGPKGNLTFPHEQPLPVELIARVATALAAQYATD